MTGATQSLLDRVSEDVTHMHVPDVEGSLIIQPPMSSLVVIEPPTPLLGVFRIVHKKPAKQVLILPKRKQVLASSEFAVSWHHMASSDIADLHAVPVPPEMVVSWKSASTSGADADGVQMMSLPTMHSLDDVLQSVREWTVKRISFNALDLPFHLRSMPGVQEALNCIFRSGAFPGELCPQFTLDHGQADSVEILAALQALEAGGFLTGHSLMKKCSTWQATKESICVF